MNMNMLMKIHKIREQALKNVTIMNLKLTNPANRKYTIRISQKSETTPSISKKHNHIFKIKIIPTPSQNPRLQRIIS